MARSTLRIALLVSATVLCVPQVANSQDTTLLFATTNAPTAHLNVRVIHPWAERLNKEGVGVVKIDVRDGPAVANHTNYYDRTLNDVIQIAWGLHTGAAGKFPRTEVNGIPFVTEKSEASSVALHRLYRSGILNAEYDEAVPLMFVAFPTGQLHFRSALKSPGDLRGLKIISGSKTLSEVVSALDAAPVSIIVTDVYQALQRGTADGTTTPWTAFEIFKLAEVTKYHIEVPIGGGTGHVMMAKKKYAALPDAARRLIDKYAAEGETRTFGKFWDAVQEEGREIARKANHTIVQPTPAQTAAWKQKLAAIESDWVKRTPDGENVLSRFRALVQDVKAGS
jgi:TRAP-type C4-dicarboxylate transport system substrate-binding protein